ncbi:O-methyltransferase [Paenibacillus solani]|uniref:Methyltransferase n=1 Tax=Paenibacillus solani TaxID=1705565 RepID=A0A0M1P774_9BACL|nr:class I SAM-dependent methyltransferase [Paenibacillus solani]KOR90257.1 hypothetical protein AM231_14700 [Paenibacillus solani]
MSSNNINLYRNNIEYYLFHYKKVDEGRLGCVQFIEVTLTYLSWLKKQKSLASEYGFTQSCTDEFGRFLYTLIGQVKGNILEIGTGLGVSTSWIVSSMSANSSNLISIDNQQDYVGAIKPLFTQYNVEFIVADWKEIINKGPFDFVFADAADAKSTYAQELFKLLKVGGVLIMDDLTPEEYWPAEWRGKRDVVRDYWLNHPKLAATEILLTPQQAVIIASKLEE